MSAVEATTHNEPPLAKAIESLASHTPHPEHRGLGFREPDDAEASPAHDAPAETSQTLPRPEKRHYREKRRTDEKEKRPPTTEPHYKDERLERPREKERSPPRERHVTDCISSNPASDALNQSENVTTPTMIHDMIAIGETAATIAAMHGERVTTSGRAVVTAIETESGVTVGTRGTVEEITDAETGETSGGTSHGALHLHHREGKKRLATLRTGMQVPSVGGGRDGGDRRPRPDDAVDEPMPELYSIHRGTVTSVQSFGAFVKFEGRKHQGLVHVSQLSNYHVENPRDMLAEGDSVWVKVVGVKEDGKKISLSVKLVNQTTGQDLDVNNVALTMSQRKRGGGGAERGPIELGYALPTTCTKCGGAGHLASECKVASGGAHYDLLPEPPAGSSSDLHREHHQHHHHKEKKKEKKHKHKKHRSEKKEKKHKKKHQGDSSSSSSSSSD